MGEPLKKEVEFEPHNMPEIATIRAVIALIESEDFDNKAIKRITTYVDSYFESKD